MLHSRQLTKHAFDLCCDVLVVCLQCAKLTTQGSSTIYINVPTGITVLIYEWGVNAHGFDAFVRRCGQLEKNSICFVFDRLALQVQLG
mmetsp:Transcript_28113/g.65072  ORF Transcript_28113/g.65072 Transcript_28113/m.65072 type:complete len:88 (-) Transcript_28113:26-289(-)